MEKNLTTVEGCFIATNRDPKILPIVDHLPERDAKKTLADYKWSVVVEAINEGIPANWADASESKYILWPDVVVDKSKPSGFGLSYFDYVVSVTAATVPSRLTFRNRAGAKFAYDHHLELFEEVYL